MWGGVDFQCEAQKGAVQYSAVRWDVVPGYTRSRVKSLHTVHFSEIECRACGRVARVGPGAIWELPISRSGNTSFDVYYPPYGNTRLRWGIIRLISIDDVNDEQLMRGDSETLFNSLIIFWNIRSQCMEHEFPIHHLCHHYTVSILGNPELSDQIMWKGKNMWGLLTHTTVDC